MRSLAIVAVLLVAFAASGVSAWYESDRSFASLDASLDASLSAPVMEPRLAEVDLAAQNSAAAEALSSIAAEHWAATEAQSQVEAQAYAQALMNAEILLNKVPAGACALPVAGKDFSKTRVASIKCGPKGKEVAVSGPGSMKPGESCIMTCNSGLITRGRKFFCKQSSKTGAPVLKGSQRCVPACVGMANNPEYKPFTNGDGPGTCAGPVARKKRCKISCGAGRKSRQPYMRCDKTSLRFKGALPCQSKAELKAKRQAAAVRALNTNKVVVAKTKHKMLLEQQTRIVEATRTPVTASELDAAQQQQVVDSLRLLSSQSNSRSPRFQRLLNEAVQHAENELVARNAAKAQVGDDQESDAGMITEMVGKLAPALVNEDNFFGAFLKDILDKLTDMKAIVAGDASPVFKYGTSWRPLAGVKAEEQVKGEVIRSGKLPYYNLFSVLFNAAKGALTKKFDQTTYESKEADGDVCQKIPVHEDLSYSYFSLIVQDNALCFVWAHKDANGPNGLLNFGVYFKLGDVVKKFIPPPFNIFDGAGLALSTGRKLRLLSYKNVAFGWGIKDHIIVPASCQSSGAQAHAYNAGYKAPPKQDVATGCLGNLWAQLDVSFSFADLFDGGDAVDGAVEGLPAVDLGFEGTALIFIDWGVNTEPAEDAGSLMAANMANVAPKTVTTETDKKNNGLTTFVKGSIKSRAPAFTLLLQVNVALVFTLDLFIKFEARLFVFADILVQVNTFAKLLDEKNPDGTPHPRSANGLYIKVGAGVAGKFDNWEESKKEAAHNKAKEVIAARTAELPTLQANVHKAFQARLAARKGKDANAIKTTQDAFVAAKKALADAKTEIKEKENDLNVVGALIAKTRIRKFTDRIFGWLVGRKSATLEVDDEGKPSSAAFSAAMTFSISFNGQGVSLVGQLANSYSLLIRVGPAGLQVCYSTPTKDSPCEESAWVKFKRLFVKDKANNDVGMGFEQQDANAGSKRIITYKEGWEVVVRLDQGGVFHFRKECGQDVAVTCTEKYVPVSRDLAGFLLMDRTGIMQGLTSAQLIADYTKGGKKADATKYIDTTKSISAAQGQLTDAWTTADLATYLPTGFDLSEQELVLNVARKEGCAKMGKDQKSCESAVVDKAHPFKCVWTKTGIFTKDLCEPEGVKASYERRKPLCKAQRKDKATCLADPALDCKWEPHWVTQDECLANKRFF